MFVKARFIKGEAPTGRAYTYRSNDALKAGDIVTNDRGNKLVVVDEKVDMAWLNNYGINNLATVKKCEDIESEEK